MTTQKTSFRPALGLGLAALMLAALMLAACQGAPNVGLAKTGGDIPVLRLAEGKVPPAADGQCWASDTAPAVIETVTEQMQIRPEQRDTTGNVIQAAQFQTRTAQRMVNDRETIWFKAPCETDITVAFVASLQRALKARGWFFAPVTGAWDADTLAALRNYQRGRGLDTAQISLAAAQDLGLIAAPL